MSKRNKLQKFAEILAYPNVLENFDPKAPRLLGKDGEEVERRGRWASAQFENDHPIVLELACGRGEYSLGLARRFPEKNFIGLDIKGARIWKGATIALREGLTNVAFLRTRIEQLPLFFAPEEVAEIWITFPDPFLKKSKANRRLTAPAFLQRYRQVLQPGATVHLKTDSPELYAFTLETLAADPDARIHYQCEDIYASPLAFPELELKTWYERLHLNEGKTIKYLRFEL